MRVLGIIPARYGSTRFPGKPLALIHGRSMISRVYEQAGKCNLLSRLVVATDDRRIFEHVTAFGGGVIMTAADHPNGTSRCREVLDNAEEEFDAVVNIQGDEPYIHPDQISDLIRCLDTGGTPVATLVKKITREEDLDNPNVVKVTRQANGLALYFSRSPIPFCLPSERRVMIDNGLFFRHVGIYAYRSRILRVLPSLTPTALERAESLEQLRWLEQGVYINTAITDFENHAVDTPEDVSGIERLFAKDPS